MQDPHPFLGKVVRFIALPFAVSAAFVLSYLIGEAILRPFILWRNPIIGPFCALSIGLTTFWITPVHKKSVGFAVLAVGLWLTWDLLKGDYYPERHPKAYEPTHIPMITTMVAGIVSYIICCLVGWKRDRKTGKHTRRLGKDFSAH